MPAGSESRAGQQSASAGGGRGGRGAGTAVQPQDRERLKASLDQLAKIPPNAKVKGKRSSQAPGLSTNYGGDPERGVRAGTPYYETANGAGGGQESSVDRENIPAAYRKQVKDYFESIRR